MKRAIAVHPAAAWPAHQAADRVALDHDGRHRRRIRLMTVSGQVLLLDLPETTRLRHGDGLQLEDGSWVAVEARPEPLLEITAPDPHSLIRIAWHLGNRHLPTQLVPGAIRIRDDHVIAEMVLGLGGTVSPISAPFDPEAGAYAGGGHHHHHHDDDHDHHHHH
jgi:urease accessory protein